MLEVLGLVDLHYVVGALLLVVAIMGVFAGHLRHHLLLQVPHMLQAVPSFAFSGVIACLDAWCHAFLARSANFEGGRFPRPSPAR